MTVGWKQSGKNHLLECTSNFSGFINSIKSYVKLLRLEEALDDMDSGNVRASLDSLTKDSSDGIERSQKMKLKKDNMKT